MGAAVGLVFAVGVVLMWEGVSGRDRWSRPRRRGRGATTELLASAGYAGVAPERLWGLCAGTGLVVAVAVGATSGSVVVALAFAMHAASAPIALVKSRARQRSTELRDVWPGVVDNLASAVRAGMSLPD